MSAVYDGLVTVLRRYVSPISVDSTLAAALEKRQLTPATLGPEELPELVASAMVGLRIFCDPERLGDLMVDLAEYCETVAAAPPPGDRSRPDS